MFKQPLECINAVLQGFPAASEMTYIVSDGALNSTHSLAGVLAPLGVVRHKFRGRRTRCWEVIQKFEIQFPASFIAD